MKETSEDSLKKLFSQNLSCLIQGAAYLWVFTVAKKYKHGFNLLATSCF